MHTQKKAVAPVLATILMIAVAVAMSVILFMWSQNFLGNTSNSVGGQQGAQNQAAQSSISVESATDTAGGSITVVVRNVGAVTESLGSLTVEPGGANVGIVAPMTVPITGTTLPKGTAAVLTLPTAGGATTITVSGSGAVAGTGGTVSAYTSKSGDVLSVKATSTVGTFGVASIQVP